jgi:hypothetical protein
MRETRPRPATARLRSHWFKSERPRTAGEVAAAVAFVVWRIAQQVVRNMRRADFEIEAGDPYFDFLAEWLIFLAQAADRVAFERLPDQRVAFTTVVANRVAETLADNQADLLGTAPERDRKSAFIDLFNLRLDDYTDFGRDDYGRMRYLAQKLSHVAGPRDQLWVHEQVMEIEAPAAVDQLCAAIDSLLDPAPRPTRRAGGVSGE